MMPSLILCQQVLLYLTVLYAVHVLGNDRGTIRVSDRSNIASFKVMDVLARALELESQGREICHMEVGQPSTKAPQKVIETAKETLDSDQIGYTSALGIKALRDRIAQHYLSRYGVEIKPEQVVVTTGSSASFMLGFLGLFDVGDAVAACSSGYPCYRNIMKATGINHVSIPINEEFKVTAASLQAVIDQRAADRLPPLRGLILSSPSNPTGAMLSAKELESLCAVCEKHNIIFISDEIYHGISYGDFKEATAAQFSSQAVVINSFSKYYSMTGWRLGWMVLPEKQVDVMNRLAQNMYISAPTLSQIAACAAFDCTDELDGNVALYAENRRTVLDTLESLGLLEGAAPSHGAFYIYVDLSKFGVTDSAKLCYRLLEEAGLAITPGIDFEDPASGLGLRRVRFSYSRSPAEVTEGMRRFKEWWNNNYPFQKQEQQK